MYSEKVLDHFTHPRNVGELPDADGVGTVGNPQCGDIMRFYIKVDNGIITDITFKTFGCGAAVATSSMATELVKGRTLDEALTTMGMAAAGEMDKQIIFLNVDGFWQPVIDFMEQLHRMGMLRHEPGHYFQVAGSVEELIKMITD